MIARIADFRVARPTNALAPLKDFYISGLGLEVLFEFSGHAGFDGLILKVLTTGAQIEFTVAHGHEAPRAPTQDHLFALYIADPKEFQAAVQRMTDAGYAPVPSFNPYWDQRGRTFEDPDGYRVVIMDGAYPAE